MRIILLFLASISSRTISFSPGLRSLSKYDNKNLYVPFSFDYAFNLNDLNYASVNGEISEDSASPLVRFRKLFAFVDIYW